MLCCWNHISTGLGFFPRGYLRVYLLIYFHFFPCLGILYLLSVPSFPPVSGSHNKILPDSQVQLLARKACLPNQLEGEDRTRKEKKVKPISRRSRDPHSTGWVPPFLSSSARRPGHTALCRWVFQGNLSSLAPSPLQPQAQSQGQA